MHPSLPTSALARIRACLPQLAQHGLKVAAFCLAIALGLWWLRPGMSLDAQLVYSFSTGLVTWLFIDLGRFFVDRDSPYGFPRGWRAVVLILAGCVVGHVLGTLVGDAYCGGSTWALFQDRPRMLLNFLLLSIVTGGAISYFFYAAGKSHYLRSALEASQSQATEAQLKLLQSQLDPHMLFNTLANLRALIATDPPRATHMLDRLNDYLRSTLGASRATEHPLSAEFDRLRDYLELMQIRMGQRLRYQLDLPAALASVPVPPLILQSLVENCIVHGLEPQVEGGSITISARQEGATLVLQVSDTGMGFDAQLTAEGFGITQVRERLATRYGSLATIHLVAACANKQGAAGQNGTQNSPANTSTNAPTSGTSAVLRLPMSTPAPTATQP
jgi:signal transduction histidine kinase